MNAAIGYGYLRNPDGISEDWITSGDYALDVAGEIVPAKIGLRPFYDPENRRLKS